MKIYHVSTWDGEGGQALFVQSSSKADALKLAKRYIRRTYTRPFPKVDRVTLVPFQVFETDAEGSLTGSMA